MFLYRVFKARPKLRNSREPSEKVLDFRLHVRCHRLGSAQSPLQISSHAPLLARLLPPIDPQLVVVGVSRSHGIEKLQTLAQMRLASFFAGIPEGHVLDNPLKRRGYVLFCTAFVNAFCVAGRQLSGYRTPFRM